jgi:glycine betaine/proline transport system permease protein
MTPIETTDTLTTPASATLDAWGRPVAADANTPAMTTPEAPADAWQSAVQPTPDTAASASDWLDAPAPAIDADTVTGFQIHQLWDGSLPVENWINQALDWVVLNFRPFFQTVRVPIDNTLGGVEGVLQSMPALAMIGLIAVLAWQFAGRAVAMGAAHRRHQQPEPAHERGREQAAGHCPPHRRLDQGAPENL